MNLLGWCGALASAGFFFSCGGEVPAPRVAEAQTEAEVRQARQALVDARENAQRQEIAANPPQLGVSAQAVAPPAIGGGPRPQVEEAAVTDPEEGTQTESRAPSAEDAASAMDKVAIAAGSVRLEPRGTVITLRADALFDSNGATLLPAAEEKLSLVAQALQGQRGRSIAIEGFTDASGADAANRQLSQSRADAIRAYLVSRGLSASDLRARGLGGIRPIADNGSIAGRARNHRVEIVVESNDKP